MPSGREELRRGVRSVIEAASRELGALTDAPLPEAPPVGTPATPAREERPILRLVREQAPRPLAATESVVIHPTRGVCAAYQVSHACWEVSDAYCNQALHVCMLRDCPVFNLHRERLERRFAAKFAHLW